MKDVAVLGVGMYRFGMWADVPTATMLRIAGMEALKDAGISFRDVGTAYVGHIFDKVMAGTRGMKELGLTGIPIVHVENGVGDRLGRVPRGVPRRRLGRGRGRDGRRLRQDDRA